MFVDRAVIQVKAGDGGDGCVSFRREKFVPKGGPDGGDGGRGGSIFVVGDANKNTLLDFRHHTLWRVPTAEKGRSRSQSGAGTSDLVILLPPGTLVVDDSNGQTLADLREGDRVVVARGGEGGKGNERFKTSTNQAPRQSTPGEPGEERTLRLELRLIADVGLVGKPNAGKSTLLAATTRATPKIAGYAFTTLSPQLGIAELDAERRLVIADLPGLIEGAAQGAGLGHDFLRHIERTRVIVHLVEPRPDDGSDPAENYRLVRRELEQHSAELAEKPEILALSKADLLEVDEVRRVVSALRASLQLGAREEVLPISGVSRDGVRSLLEACWRAVHGEPIGGLPAARREER